MHCWSWAVLEGRLRAGNCWEGTAEGWELRQGERERESIQGKQMNRESRRLRFGREQLGERGGRSESREGRGGGRGRD